MMVKHVFVTSVQRDAARLIIKRSEAKGKAVPSEIRKIAEAQPYDPDELPATSAPSPQE
jgi:hypothetical protein